jgi:hypothetical protein
LFDNVVYFHFYVNIKNSLYKNYLKNSLTIHVWL